MDRALCYKTTLIAGSMGGAGAGPLTSKLRLYVCQFMAISKEMELLASKMHNQANQQLNASTGKNDLP